MKIIKRTSTLQRHLSKLKNEKLKIGFVPTMGALHQGHIKLIERSKLENDISVVSIFVNPTQFNQKEDLINYPRNLANDASLIKHCCDYLYAPSVNQVYSNALPVLPVPNINHLIQSMEGPNRPGHFEGVVQVVRRLLQIVDPHALYMGQKDYQQFTIINYMIEQLGLDVSLKVCETIREEDGLAMSSRNVRLTPAFRKKAGAIYKNLTFAKSKIKEMPVAEIEQSALEALSSAGLKPEYFEIVDGLSLRNVKNVKKHKSIVACTAVWAGKVRLIDNMILK